jgi:DNA-binding NarL/FixJ family response regulator
LNAMAAHTRAATTLAEGRPSDALIHLRRALAIWAELDAPYELARVRSMVGLACRALDDRDTATLEMEAARRTFAELGAVSDEARVASVVEVIASRSDAADTHGLTARELEVLRLLAAGKSNREIGEALFISEHTVARHVQNIFAKLDVSSRAAATAFAFSHQLV